MDEIRGKKGGFDWKRVFGGIIISLVIFVIFYFLSKILNNYGLGRLALIFIILGLYGSLFFLSKPLFKIVALITILFLLFGSIIHGTEYCVITEKEQLIAGERGFKGWLQSSWNFIRENIFQCEKERVGIIEKTKGFFKDILGLNVSFWDFIPTFVTGLLIGVWLRLICISASIKNLADLLDRFNIFKKSKKSKQFHEGEEYG